MSKDLSILSNTSNSSSMQEQSFRQAKKSYIRLVSNSCQKDLSLLSNSKICLTPQIGSQRVQPSNNKESNFFKETNSHKRNDSSLDVKELREIANDIVKSTAILNDRIVPVLLQAAKGN